VRLVGHTDPTSSYEVLYGFFVIVVVAFDHELQACYLFF
jgi:hypothetical protein